jgi:hypothetical protein
MVEKHSGLSYGLTRRKERSGDVVGGDSVEVGGAIVSAHRDSNVRNM